MGKGRFVTLIGRSRRYLAIKTTQPVATRVDSEDYDDLDF
jgi:hypothetical protein